MNAYPNPKLPNFIQIWIYRFSGQMGPLWSTAWPPASCRPGNATRQFPRSAEAAPLCKSALSCSVASLKWSLVESVQLPSGLQLCFPGCGCASPKKQFCLCSSLWESAVERDTSSREGPGDQALFPTAWDGEKVHNINQSPYRANVKEVALATEASRSPTEAWWLLAQGKSSWTSERRDLWPLLFPFLVSSGISFSTSWVFSLPELKSLSSDTPLKPQKPGGSFCGFEKSLGKKFEELTGNKWVVKGR